MMAPRRLTIKENILAANGEAADQNRNLLAGHRVRMVSITAGPGAGKTSLIIHTINRLRSRHRIAVIEGSIASSIDADKLAGQNIPAISVNPGGGCHLDAIMIGQALGRLDLDQLDLIFIENVGNLVCTADFDLGAQKNVVILSVPEGDDKPQKYPTLFMDADAVLVNKIDALAHFDFNLEAFPRIIGALNPSAKVFAVSAKTGDGMDCWFSWVEEILG